VVAHHPVAKTVNEVPAAAEHRLTSVKVGGVGFGAFIALAFGDLSSVLVKHAPAALMAVFATTLVLAGFALVRTYAAFRNCTTGAETLTENDKSWPVTDAANLYSVFAEEKDGRVERVVEGRRLTGNAALVATEYVLGVRSYSVAIGLVVGSVALFLIATWWSALSS
jgi:hypothetical protein